MGPHPIDTNPELSNGDLDIIWCSIETKLPIEIEINGVFGFLYRY